MRRLWSDIQAHRLSAGLVFACWLIPVCFELFGWGKPSGRDDILTSVMYLIFCSAVLAGAMVGWWRRFDTGEFSGGMLAGGLLLALAVTCIAVSQFVHSIANSKPDGESVLELPVFATIVGLFGSVLGLAGSGISAAWFHLLGGRKPEHATARLDEEQPPSVRRKLFLAAAIALIAAFTIAVVVIPPVAADVYPQAAPGRVSKAFGVVSAVDIGIALVLLSPLALRRGIATRTILTVTGLVALGLGFMLLNGAGIGGHGRDLIVAAVASGICAAADFAVAGLTFRVGRSM